jgi:hypothetical protein
LSIIQNPKMWSSTSTTYKKNQILTWDMAPCQDFLDDEINTGSRTENKLEVEGLVGFEPTTRGLKGRCSNLLSYRPANIAASSSYSFLFCGKITPYIIWNLTKKSSRDKDLELLAKVLQWSLLKRLAYVLQRLWHIWVINSIIAGYSCLRVFVYVAIKIFQVFNLAHNNII